MKIFTCSIVLDSGNEMESRSTDINFLLKETSETAFKFKNTIRRISIYSEDKK